MNDSQSRQFFSVRPIWTLTLVLGWLGACSDDTKKDLIPVASPSSYAGLWNSVFHACGGCHGSGTNTGTAGGPDLRTKTGFYEAMVDRGPSRYPDWDTTLLQTCQDQIFIRKGSADTSMVVAVLDSATNLGECVVLKHQNTGKITISASDLAALKEWINAGAQP